MENEFIKKLDRELYLIYNQYLLTQKEKKENLGSGDEKNRYNVSLRYQNELSEVEELGFETSWNEIPGFANGYISLQDLERVASHSNVVSLSSGSGKEIYLDHSVEDIKVRANTSANIGTNGLWHIDPATGTITSVPSGFSGRGVIVGIIDTGLDVTHPVFTTGTFPAYSSRIIRYWDQGLTPVSGEAGPPASLLTVSHTYGVQYDKTQIESFLNGPSSCRSKDCVGHGTHVAATAAGNGNPGEGLPPHIPRSDFNFVGVAPEADIIGIKLIDTPNSIKDTANNNVSGSTRFRDAVMYILNVAKSEVKPAVINCSFGSSLGPHDGLTENEQFLDALFSSGSTYYNGNIIVFAAGNSAGARQHARITIPASGEIIVPFTLFDTRKNTNEYRQCRWQDATWDLLIDMWYKEVTAPQDVSAQVKVPRDTDFSSPVFSGFLTKTFDGNKTRTLVHNAQTPVNRSGILVQRNNIYLHVEPNRRTKPAQHSQGLYEIKVSGPQGTVIQTWTDQSGRLGFRIGTFTILTASGSSGDTNLTVHDATGFQINDTIEISLDAGGIHTTTISGITPGGPPDTDQITISIALPSPAGSGKSVQGRLDPAIVVEDRFLIGSNAGAKNSITVAAYNDNDGITSSPYRHITSFSSRGPLADYSGSGPYADKPEVAGPGFKIEAAMSIDMDGGVGLKLSQLFGNRFTVMSGTSMAAPHITGLIALLLQKNKNLTVDQVKTIFRNSANNQDGINPTPAVVPDYQEAYGGGIADGKKSADAVP